MRIIEDEKTCDVIIDGTRIEGFIWDKKCKICDNLLIYYDKYDAFFCACCNEWVEPKCGDVNCQYCKNRPEKPL
jgi:hypothetical protein